jgi:hypothetical protein
VDKTNIYYKKHRQTTKTELEETKIHNKTSCEEIYLFFAINMLMSRIRKNSLKEYWSQDPILKAEIFNGLMSRNRFEFLLQMIYFADPFVTTDDPLFKLKIVVDSLRKSFLDVFYPYEKLCIDESLLLFKGRCHFKQYIPNKRSRFGIKSFLICDFKTGFVQDFIIYSGKKTEIKSSKLVKDLDKSGEVVLTLLKPYLGKGHMVITDNWYTSPNLYRVLSENHTNGFGTAKKNRKGMPIIDEKLQKG